MGRMRWGAVAAALVLVVAGCGDDDEDEGASASASTEATDASGGEESGEEGGDGEFAELCALAEEMFEQDDFPSVEQLEQYRELAPDEITDAVEAAAPPLIESSGDPVASMIAFSEDDVEEAVAEIDAFEEEECGIPHSENGGPSADGPEDGATVVGVVASEYTFEVGEVASGPTSFVLTNEGQEAHFLLVTKIAEGHTLDEALAFEGDPEAEGLVEDPSGESGLAAPGGEDEEFLTLDLEPGDYAMLCFLPGPDGTPHAFSGMAVPFTVT